MTDAEIPQFRIPNEGEPIPAVDPEDLKRNWKIQPGDKEALIAEWAQGLDNAAIGRRNGMIKRMTAFNHGQLLAPWQHGAELDDAVFRVAATFPIWPLRQHVYKVPGDSMAGFDPNAFVEKLIEETGISHTWEPVLARIPEGSGVCSYFFIRVGSGRTTFPPQPDSEHEVRQKISELLWAVWSKCHSNLCRPSPGHEPFHTAVIATRFADFAIDNVDLAREFVSHPAGGETRDRLTIVLELERRAYGWEAPPQ
jgi:hypothetical protein